MPIYPVDRDFTEALRLPEALDGAPRLGFFPGSTIGNLLVPEAVDLLRRMAAALGEGAMLLIGVDRIKDPSVLLPAYDDAQGVTAAFNLNLLHRINRELGGTAPVDAFRHLVRWNDTEARIEMHLEAARDVQFEVDGLPFRDGQRARRSIPRTASNTVRATPACCFAPAAGRRSPIGPTSRNTSR